MRQADYGETKRWLARHGLPDTEPTPLIRARLAARRRAKLYDSILLGAFFLGVGLIHALRLPGTALSWPPLLALVALAVGLLAAQWLIGAWVRRVDRRAAAQLSRRVAHPVQLGRPELLGRPHAIFSVATLVAAMLLAVSVLPVPDPALRYGAVTVLIGLAGAGVSIVLQLRQVVASPAVAEDEASLTADVLMRVEDARALVTPAQVPMLPAIFLYGESLGWWNAVALLLVVVGVLAFAVVEMRSAGVGTAARRALATG